MNHESTPHDERLPERQQVVVVGAGLGGLLTAARLARQGDDVLVLDSRSMGGRARTIDVDGFRLNDGPHALYRSGTVATSLAELGVTIRGAVPPVSAGRLLDRGVATAIPASPRSLLTTQALSTSSKVTAPRVLRHLMRGEDAAAAGLSVEEWFDRRRVPADLRRVLRAIIRLITYSADLDRLDATTAIAQFGLSMDGVWYVDGGWQTLVDDLAGVVRDAGGVIREGVAVRSVRRSARGWQIETGETAIGASAVVVASGGPAVAAALVGDDPGWTEQAGPAPRVASIDYGVADAPSIGLLLDLDAPLYASRHDPPASLAPQGSALVGAMRYLSADDDPDRHELTAALDAHVARLGVDVEGATVHRYLHRMTVAHGSPRPGVRRPTGDELAADGLWCVGDWVAPASAPHALLADATGASARTAADAVHRHLQRVPA